MTNQFETTLLQHLPEAVLKGLPQHLLDVPRQITDITGIHVLVKPLRKEDFAFASGWDRAPALLDIDPRGQTITIFVGDAEITTAEIGHELIHLRRAVLESIPRLIPGFDAHPSIKGNILGYENELEHLFVIPEEIRTFPDAENRWVEHYRHLITRAAERGAREDLMFAYAQLRNSLPNQIDLGRTLVDHLRGCGGDWLRDADYLREDFKQAMQDKNALHALIQTNCPSLLSHMGTARFSAEKGYLGVESLSFAGEVYSDEDE
jgi:hypothetical protein